MQNKCLSEDFFNNLNTLYENCYRINPKPNYEFLERMQLIELGVRKLRDDLEEIQESSYRYLDQKVLTQDEKDFLKGYRKSRLIMDSFMPLITAAFTLTEMKESDDQTNANKDITAQFDLNLSGVPSQIEELSEPEKSELKELTEPDKSEPDKSKPDKSELEELLEEYEFSESSDFSKDLRELEENFNDLEQALRGLGDELEGFKVIEHRTWDWDTLIKRYQNSSLIKFMQQIGVDGTIQFYDEDAYLIIPKTNRVYSIDAQALEHDLDAALEANDSIIQDFYKLVKSRHP